MPSQPTYEYPVVSVDSPSHYVHRSPLQYTLPGSTHPMTIGEVLDHTLEWMVNQINAIRTDLAEIKTILSAGEANSADIKGAFAGVETKLAENRAELQRGFQHINHMVQNVVDKKNTRHPCTDIDCYICAINGRNQE